MNHGTTISKVSKVSKVNGISRLHVHMGACAHEWTWGESITEWHSGRGSALYRTYTKMRGSPPRELRQVSLINQILVLFIFRSGHWKAPDSNERIVEMLRAKQSTTLACMF